MARFGLVLPPWDYAAAAGNLLERARGEVGIDYLLIPVVTGRRRSFRPRWFPDEPLFHTEGGWHYPCKAALYATSGVRPHRARWAAQRDVLAGMLDAAARSGLRVFFGIDLQQPAQWLESEPHLLECNAWGQPKEPAGACLLSPQVRELFRAALSELARFEPAGFALPGLTLDRSCPGQTNDAVRDTCFCAACRNAALEGGIDAQAAARSVRVLSGQHFSSAAAARDAVAAEPLLAAYRGQRLRAALAWTERLRAEFSEREFLFGDALLAGDDGATGVIQRRIINASAPGPHAAPQSGQGPTHLTLHAGAWEWPDRQPDFVRACAQAAAAQPDYLDLDEVAKLPTQFISRWRQAVRYARRVAGQ